MTFSASVGEQQLKSLVSVGRKHPVVPRGSPVALTCGVQFDGQRVQLNLSHLRMYSRTVQSLLERFQ